jgi:hypothetical protein
MKPERAQTWWQGLIAGMIGYATTVIVIAVVNLIAGRSPFHTAALLGSSLFYGLTDPASLVIWPGPVLAYNGLHLLVFLGLGALAAWIIHEAERGPHFWYLGAIVMGFVVFHLFGAFLLVTAPIRAALPVWSFVVGGVAALVTMSAYLIRVHPRLRAEFRDFAAQDPDLAESVK